MSAHDRLKHQIELHARDRLFHCERYSRHTVLQIYEDNGYPVDRINRNGKLAQTRIYEYKYIEIVIMTVHR